MKYLRLWLHKQIPRSYQRLDVRGLDLDRGHKCTETFCNETRKRVQDLELVVREMSQEIAKMKGQYE